MKVAILEDNPDVGERIVSAIKSRGWQTQWFRKPSQVKFEDDVRVILLDRDSRDSKDIDFHRTIPNDRWGMVISISSVQDWNALAVSRGCFAEVEKDFSDLDKFTDQVMRKIEEYSNTDLQWRLPDVNRTREILVKALSRLCKDIPSLKKDFYWMGTAAVSYEETGHWVSLDIDMTTKRTFQNIDNMTKQLSELSYVKEKRTVDSGFFHGVISEGGEKVHLDVTSSNEFTPSLHPSSLIPGLMYEGLRSYLRKKVRCLEERIEAKDWVHMAILSRDQNLEKAIFKCIHCTSDPFLLVPRIESIQRDSKFFDEFHLLKFEKKAVFSFIDKVAREAKNLEDRRFFE